MSVESLSFLNDSKLVNKVNILMPLVLLLLSGVASGAYFIVDLKNRQTIIEERVGKIEDLSTTFREQINKD
ncbi:hypothetical protein [Vibrio parahaemolyticus]|uniref:hypothetical protein n=1 Tax=Vibrio parahaemolyticus TaxID=670 RepID=UPI00402BA272